MGLFESKTKYFVKTKMIDKKTGHIIITDKIHIMRDDYKNDILSFNIGQTRKQWDHRNGWSWV